MPKFNDLSDFNANPLTPFLLVFRSSLAVVLSRAGRKQYASPCTLTYSPWLSSICESLPRCVEGGDARALVEDSKGRTIATFCECITTAQSIFANLDIVCPLATCSDFSDTLHGALRNLFVLECIQNEFQDQISL